MRALPVEITAEGRGDRSDYRRAGSAEAGRTGDRRHGRVSKELGFDPAKVNPDGGAIAMGHPVAATGCILSVQAIAELQRTEGRYALVTMCIGGGQGIAVIYERF